MNNSDKNLKLDVFSGVKGIHKICDRWVDLAYRCSATHLMQLPEYYLSYAELLARTPGEMLIAAFYDNQELVAIMPLRFSRRAKYGINFGILEFPSTPMPVRGFLLSEHIRFQALVTCLSNQFASAYGQQWDMMRLEGIAQPLTNDAAPNEKPVIKTTTIAKNNFIQLCQGDYVQDILSSKMRSNLRRRMKKLIKRGHFEFRTISKFPELNSAYDAFVETEASGWKSRRGGKRAIKLNPDQRSFYYDLAVRHAKYDRCHIHLLEVDGQAIASDFCLLAGNSAFTIKHGFDEAFSDASPSHLLREYTIKYYSGRDDIQTIDFISGYAWQNPWKPASRDVKSLVAFNRTILGRALKAYMQLKARKSKRLNG